MPSVTQAEIDAMVAQLELDGTQPSSKVPTTAFIGGQYLDPSTVTDTFTSFNPATMKTVAVVHACNETHVNKAVESARAAFGPWSSMHPSERKEIILKFALLLEEHLLELAVLDCVEAGKPISDNLEGDVPDTVGCTYQQLSGVVRSLPALTPLNSPRSQAFDTTPKLLTNFTTPSHQRDLGIWL